MKTESAKLFLKVGFIILGIIIGVLVSAFGGYILGRSESPKEPETSEIVEVNAQESSLLVIE